MERRGERKGEEGKEEDGREGERREEEGRVMDGEEEEGRGGGEEEEGEGEVLWEGRTGLLPCSSPATGSCRSDLLSVCLVGRKITGNS